MRINHPGEVNRARYCPGNVFMIATKANSGDVLVFDYSKHASSPKDTLFRPQVRCKGHDKVGYGLSWHPSVSGTLLSGAEDGSICIWDVQSGGGSKSADSAAASSTSASSSSAASGGAGGSAAGFAACTELQPLHKLAAHGGMCVNDVAWHRHNRDIFASVGDDRGLAIWDVRTLSGKAAPTHTVDAAHSNDAMSVSFNPFQEFLLITGGKDSLVKLWDTRTLRAPMHVFEGHQKAVGTVAFSPFDEGVFASAGEDRRVMVWDCSRIGEEQTDEDKEDGPPELLVSTPAASVIPACPVRASTSCRLLLIMVFLLLLPSFFLLQFIHGGHTERVSDFSWNEHPDAEWFVSSVADDNILQVWQMASNIYIRDEEEGYADGAGVDDGEVE